MMKLQLTSREFRLLLDLVYAGNWVINSIRGDDRIGEYDQVESAVFAHCRTCGLDQLVEGAESVPSAKYVDGGIHEAIAFYEDNVFYEILAEELSRRDMEYPEINEDNYDEIVGRMNRYMSEFQASGLDHLVLED